MNRRYKSLSLILTLFAITLVVDSAHYAYFDSQEDESFASPEVSVNPSEEPAPWPTPTTALDMNTTSQNVRTFVCETDENFRPDLFFRSCADGGDGISDIAWSKWEVSGADGVGVFFKNLCDPSCAEGKFIYTDVTLKLSVPVQIGKLAYLTLIDYQEIDKNGKVVEIGLSGGWNLGEDYRMFKKIMP